MSDLEKKADSAELEAQEQTLKAQEAAKSSAPESFDAPMLDDVGGAEAPFLADEAAESSQAAVDSGSPFDDLIAKAKSEEGERKEKKKSRASTKKKKLDLKNMNPRLESKDPSEVPMRWYVLQAFSGFEQRVAQAISERVHLEHMEDYFGRILVPKERVRDNATASNGRFRETERKFFPGYVLLEMKMTSDSWQLVKHTDRVLNFVGGTPERPLPITNAEAERILDRLKEVSDTPRPRNEFEVGELVRATEGAFKDFTGTVEKVDYEKNRLTVSIAIFGRSTPVELEFNQVEKES